MQGGNDISPKHFGDQSYYVHQNSLAHHRLLKMFHNPSCYMCQVS